MTQVSCPAMIYVDDKIVKNKFKSQKNGRIKKETDSYF